MLDRRSHTRRAAAVGLAVGASALVAAVVLLIVDQQSGVESRFVQGLAAERSRALLAVARVVTAGGVFWLLLLAAALFALVSRRVIGWHAASTPAISLIAGSGAAQLLKQVFDRPRPPVGLRSATAVGWAFPSGHATNSAAFFGAVAIVLLGVVVHAPTRRLLVAGAALLIVLLVGTSRVVLAVHWPSDVLAGWALGTFVAAACSLPAVRQQPVPVGGATATDGTDGFVTPAAQRLNQRS